MNEIFSNTEQYPIYIAVGLQVVRCLSDGIEPEVNNPVSSGIGFSLKHFAYVVVLMVVSASGLFSIHP